MLKTPSHIRIPHSLLDDPLFYDARLEHQAILIRMIRLAAFKPMEHDIRGNIITLNPGQLSYSEQKIAELTGKHTSKDDVEGALRHFGKKCQFLLHQVLHKKSVITFLHPDICALFKIETPPMSPPPFLQDSSIKQTEEIKNLEKQQRHDDVVFPILFLLRDSSIHQKHREEISRNFPQEVVISAVESIMQPGFVPQVSMLKSLRAACKHRWQPKPIDEDEKNKKLAIMLEGTRNKYIFVACNKHLEVVIGANVNCIVYKMPYKNFYSEVEKKGKINIKKEIAV